jgi:molecular chaperone HtpG
MLTKLPTDAKKDAFQVDFQSLIKVLGVNLYSNPKAAIRELIQNANDSCVRRSAFESFLPAINVTTLREERQIIIEDNGAGMVEEEVVSYLATIGGGKTREERQRLMTSNQQAAHMLIGQFGVGFLSSFVISDRVVVETRSFDDLQSVYWECEGTTEYQIGQGSKNDVGTRVTLFLKQSHYDLLDEDILQAAIIRYADFIAFPIYLNGNTSPINRMNAPWHIDATEFEYAKYIEHRYGVAPLSLQPIYADMEDLQVTGLIFIPPRIGEFKQRSRSVEIFQKRMFVGEDFNLIPEWVSFVCAIIDCPTLDLVASREAIISERESYRILQIYLKQAIADFIKRIAEYEKPIFLEVMKHHDWRILNGAIQDDDFFEFVKDLIPLHTDMGNLTMPKYLQRIPPRLGEIKTIYYLPNEQPFGQQQSCLFKSQGLPIIQADIVVEAFLKKYARENKSLALRQLASGVIDLMDFAEESCWRKIESRYQELGIEAKAVRFDPPEILGMAVFREDYEQARLIEQIIGGNRSLKDFMGLVGKEDSDVYKLAFNVSNPVIQRLVEYVGDAKVLNTALYAIYASSLLSSGVELTHALSQKAALAQIEILELVLDQSDYIKRMT